MTAKTEPKTFADLVADYFAATLGPRSPNPAKCPPAKQQHREDAIAYNECCYRVPATPNEDTK
jgi:hypothetical protein